MYTLFLSHNQLLQREMTLCDLLHKVNWEEVRPYIEQHLAECPGMKLSDYERLFERLRCMAPERWIVPGLFRFYIRPDTPYSRDCKEIAHDTLNATGHYLTDHAFGVPWPLHWPHESSSQDISVSSRMPNGPPVVFGTCRAKGARRKYQSR